MDYSWGGMPPRSVVDEYEKIVLEGKGWIARPPQPEFDPGTHYCEWDGSQWIVIALPPLPPPERVESHKCRIELIVRNEWSSLMVLVNAMPEHNKSIALEALYAPYYHRSSPTLNQLAALMNWTQQDIDERLTAAFARVV